MADAVVFQSNQNVLIGKAESSSAHGTAVAITAADLDSWIYEPKFSTKIEMDGGLKVATPDSGKYNDIPGAQSCDITGKILMSPGTSVTAAATPKWGKYLVACGTSVQAYTTKGHSYLPVKAGERNTMTLQKVEVARGAAAVGYSRIAAGCMGTGSIECAGIGKPLTFNFAMKGKMGATADIAAADLLTLSAFTSADAGNPWIVQSMTVTVGAVAQKISSFKLDFGNKVEPEINTADSTGYDFFSIAEREPTFSFNPLKLPKATYDPLAAWTGQTVATITLAATTGTVPFSIILPVAQIIGAEDADREGLSAWAVNCKLLRNTTLAGAAVVATIPLEATWEFLIGAKA